MKLFLSILISTPFSLVLFMFAPIIAAVVLSGIVVGCLFRGLYWLYEIHGELIPKEDKVKTTVRRHLEERIRIKNNIKVKKPI